MENSETVTIIGKKRKRESKPLTNSNNINKPATESLEPKKIRSKKTKSAVPILRTDLNVKPCLDHDLSKPVAKKEKSDVEENVCRRYPILDNQELVQKFLNVPMTNNQKGRIRQLLKDSLKGTSEFLLPDVIHNRIQSVLKSSDSLSASDLRKIRILYNMLKTAVATEKADVGGQKKKNKKLSKKVVKHEANTDIRNNEENGVSKDVKADEGDVKKAVKSVDKKRVTEANDGSKIGAPKGPKRYVVFVGNLPPDIDKDKIMQHFSEFNECIVGIRIPKRPEDKKSSIAYVELKNEPTYELALSKHHSMLGSKRINVLYTTQKYGKVTKTEAKMKSAKLIALQKAGKLIGSVPANRKRSHRRMKMKRAQAKLAAESS